MPGFDGTGPKGQGAMTGGGRGYCAVELNSIGIRPTSICGLYSRGGGRGHRNCFNAKRSMAFGFAQSRQAIGGFSRVVSKEEDLETLKIQANFLKQQLGYAQARIQEMENQEKSV